MRFCSCYGKAFLALEKKLHSSAFMNPNLGDYFAPLILFITDGEPVDVKEYPDTDNSFCATNNDCARHIYLL